VDDLEEIVDDLEEMWGGKIGKEREEPLAKGRVHRIHRFFVGLWACSKMEIEAF